MSLYCCTDLLSISLVARYSSQFILRNLAGPRFGHIRPPALFVQVDGVLPPPLLPHGPELLLHARLHLVGQHDGVLDVELAELGLVVHGVALLVPHGHPLALDGIHLAGLHDHASLPP